MPAHAKRAFLEHQLCLDEIASILQVVDKDNIAAMKKDVNKSVHDGWRSLAMSGPMSKEQKNVVQDGNTTDNVLAVEMDETHTLDARDNIVCQDIQCANDPIGNDAESHQSGLCQIRVDVDALRDFSQNGGITIIVNVGHNELPQEIQVLSLDSQSGVLEVDLT